MIYQVPKAAADKMGFVIYGLLLRLHAETDCGDPEHWPECKAFVQAMGSDNWDDWKELAEGVMFAGQK